MVLVQGSRQGPGYTTAVHKAGSSSARDKVIVPGNFLMGDKAAVVAARSRSTIVQRYGFPNDSVAQRQSIVRESRFPPSSSVSEWRPNFHQTSITDLKKTKPAAVKDAELEEYHGEYMVGPGSALMIEHDLLPADIGFAADLLGLTDGAEQEHFGSAAEDTEVSDNEVPGKSRNGGRRSVSPPSRKSRPRCSGGNMGRGQSRGNSRTTRTDSRFLFRSRPISVPVFLRGDGYGLKARSKTDEFVEHVEDRGVKLFIEYSRQESRTTKQRYAKPVRKLGEYSNSESCNDEELKPHMFRGQSETGLASQSSQTGLTRNSTPLIKAVRSLKKIVADDMIASLNEAPRSERRRYAKLFGQEMSAMSCTGMRQSMVKFRMV